MTREVVEHTPSIHINGVKDLEPGVYSADIDGHTFFLIRSMDSIGLFYIYHGEAMEQVHDITTTRVGYGTRYWFGCGACGKNCAELYMLHGVFACRTCHNLIYYASVVKGKDLSAIRWRARHIVSRLGLDNLIEDPLFKPKGMHQKTYDLLRIQHGILQIKFNERWLSMVDI